MGEMRTIKCQKCDYSKRFLLGTGLMGGNLEIAKKNFSYQIQKEIENWISEHGCRKSSCVNKPGRCMECRTLEVFYELTVKGTDDQENRYVSSCKRCGGKYELIDLEDITCPVCEGNVTVEMTGHWD